VRVSAGADLLAADFGLLQVKVAYDALIQEVELVLESSDPRDDYNEHAFRAQCNIIDLDVGRSDYPEDKTAAAAATLHQKPTLHRRIADLPYAST